MKSYILFIFFLFNISLMNGQQEQAENEHLLQIEYAGAFTGNGDLTGTSIHALYAYELFNGFYLGPRLEFIDFFSDRHYGDSDGLLINGDSKSLGVYLEYYVVNGNHFNWAIGCSGFARDWRWIYATGPNFSFTYVDEFSLDGGEHIVKRYNSLGYLINTSLVIDYNERIGNRISVNYQNDTDGFNIISLGAGLIVRF